MRVVFSVKKNKPALGKPDTGWEVVTLDSEDPQLLDIIAGSPYGHSMITWHEGHRVAAKLDMRTGVMLDFDSDPEYSTTPVTRRMIQEALRPLGCSYILTPSKSHLKSKPATANKPEQPAVERWHLYIPFAEPRVSGPILERAVANFMVRHFGHLNIDPLFDGARYHAPGTRPDLTTIVESHPLQPDWLISHYGTGNDGEEYKRKVADAKLEARGQAPKKGRTSPKQQKGGEYWRKQQDVKLATGEVVKASAIAEKTTCHCINPEHADSSPSAFVAFNEDGMQYISCSACNLTWWEKDWMSAYMDRLFYIDAELHSFYGNDTTAWDIGKFPQNGIIAPSQDAKTGLLAILAKTPLCRAKLTVRREKAGLTPCVPSKDADTSILHLPIPLQPQSENIPTDKGNALVDSWMSEMFGDYADFVMNWASVYAHTNFVRLPVLVFNGDRGVGKSGFAEMIAALYPAGSRRWDGETAGFNDELDSVFVHVDELPAAEHGHKDSKAFYRTLKSLTGGRNIAINRKFGLKYEVKNNTNMVITTNDQDPIHLNPFERATNEANNQFFVLRITRAPVIDLPKWERVQESFPGWIRTAGHRRYLTWLNSDERKHARYGLYCPITEDEESAYEESKTEVERLAEGLWRALDTGSYNGTPVKIDRMRDFFTAQDFVNLANAANTGHSGLHLSKTFRRHGWMGPIERIRFDGAQYKGCRPTPTGLALWPSKNPNL